MAFTKTSSPAKGTSIITFIRATSITAGVLKSGSTILSSNNPQDTVPVTVPKITTVRSKLYDHNLLPRNNKTAVVKIPQKKEIVEIGKIYFHTMANFIAMMVAITKKSIDQPVILR